MDLSGGKRQTCHRVCLYIQRAWDRPAVEQCETLIRSQASNDVDKTMHHQSRQFAFAYPMTVRKSESQLPTDVAVIKACELHDIGCGKTVDARSPRPGMSQK